VWKNYKEATLLLITRGCDINAVDETGSSALHLASENSYIEMMEVMQFSILKPSILSQIICRDLGIA
jgi:hypothetical protein